MTTNEQSILTTTKNSLGLLEEQEFFDNEILMHINTVMADLNQLGIGPVNGFEVEDVDQIWSDLLGEDLKLGAVKTYTHLRVKLLFDPPKDSWTATAIKEQVEKMEYRINLVREDNLPAVDEDLGEGVLDGGGV